MPRRPTAPLGAPCWSDLSTSDVTRATEFYTTLFGWTAVELGPEYGNYVMFNQGGEGIGGMMAKQPGDERPDAWLVYFATTDIEATSKAAVAAGGQVAMAAMPVMDLGAMAVLADPGGAALGLWQPNQYQGFTLVDEPGAPMWHELGTDHYDDAVRFYTETLGLSASAMSDTPQFRYHQLMAGDVAVAGVLDASLVPAAAVVPGWVAYLGIRDLDAGIATVERLGGTVGERHNGTPYGDLAVVTDPTGAAFKLVQPPA